MAPTSPVAPGTGLRTTHSVLIVSMRSLTARHKGIPTIVNAPRSSMYPPVTPNFLVPQAWNTGNQQYLPVRPVGSPGVTQTTLNHRKKVPMFFCPVSGCESRGFTEKHNFIYHMRSHEGIKPFECPRCGKPFRSQSDLTRHLKKSKKRCDSQKPY
ncbi:hypothetical protein L218DRAFT_947123 [Marasmius fiardii PR-910]|nr:hypothetical protein L218DRAFT_947123 [Marasmius fiardii PR-910]